jgi:hypothetical protein
MTGQNLLDLMEVLDNELLLQTGEEDVVRALIALNASQDLFESVVSQHPNLLGNTVGTVAVVADTETTTFPANVLRLDKLWMLDDNSRPLYPLHRVDLVGGHMVSHVAPYAAFGTRGKVNGYWTNGSLIYWSPLPSEAATVRWHGFTPANDITAGGTFAYRDIAAMPIAAFAVKMMRAGVGDDSMDLNEATAAFDPVVKRLANFNRDKAPGLVYSQSHDT